MLFVSHLADTELTHSIIKVYLFSVCHLHVTQGQHSQFSKQLTPRLQQVLKGIKKLQAATTCPRVCRPITLEIMQGIKSVLLSQSRCYQITMIWVACCLAFFGFLRSSEFTVPAQTDRFDSSTHLSPQDIAIDCRYSPSKIKVRIKQSKTDPFCQGVDLYLGKTDKNVCPVRAILPYLALRGNRLGPFFMGTNGKMLTRQTFNTELDHIISELKLDRGSYNTHSFRIGAATSAMEAGIPETQIKMLGRWQSDAYQGYVRTSAARY